MREKLKTLPLVQLREMAKAQGLKGISTLKKAEIIDRLCELEKPAEGGQKEETPQASVSEHPAGSAEPAERTEMHVQPRRTDAGQNTSAQTYSQPRRSANGERAAGGQNSSYERRSEGGYRRNEYGSYTRRENTNTRYQDNRRREYTQRDPAARNALEVLLLYQGVHALIWHRVAHWFYEHHMFFIARLISQVARFFTLIEIHPGAQLGHGILIDHGCGVVIGETAVVGDNCTIYQGVTLGGVGTQKGKRHPTLGNNVTVGSGAKILGSFEVGDNCSVAANAVLLRPLEENTTAVGIPARPVKKDGVALPKKQKMIIGEDDQRILEQIDALRKELQELREESANLRKELEAVRAGQEKA